MVIKNHIQYRPLIVNILGQWGFDNKSPNDNNNRLGCQSVVQR